MPERLPILIFAENHSDPITGIILNSLIPTLKELGYQCFLDEAPKQQDIDLTIEKHQQHAHAYEKLKKHFDQQNLTVTDDTSLLLYVVQTLKAQGIAHDLTMELLPSYLEKLQELVIRHEHVDTFLSFLEQLKTANIIYQGIDLKLAKDINKDELMRINTQREQSMSQELLSMPNSAFARVGLSHVEGLQQLILKSLTPDQAKARFIFFNIYSTPPQLGSNNLEARVRSGKAHFPLNINTIDARQYTQEELALLIVSSIKADASEQQDMKGEQTIANQSVTTDLARLGIFKEKAGSESLEPANKLTF